MKRTIISIVLFCTVFLGQSLKAQKTENISYQAVVRDAGNNLVTNQQVGMQISIMKNSEDTLPVYAETHTPTTNSNGLLSIEIGSGVSASSLAEVDWTSGVFFIKTEIDINGGSEYTIVGTSQILSVPFALHSKTAEAIVGDVNYTEKDPLFSSSVAFAISENDTANWNSKLSLEVDGSTSNELQVLSISNDTIFLSEGGFVKLPASLGFSGSFNDLSDVPANLDTDATDDFDGNYNSLSNLPTYVSTFTNDAGYLTAEVDGSVTNELQVLSISNDTIFLSEGGFVKLPASSGFSGSFNDLSDVPANLDTDATDDFDGNYNSLSNLPTNVSTFTNDAGYLTAEVDGSVTNELQVLSISNDTIFLSEGGFVKLPASSGFSGSFNDLSDVPANLDTDATDDFDGNYNSLSNLPTNVSTFTNDAGYLTAEVDGSVTNELELPAQSGHSGKFLTTDGSVTSWATVSGSSPNVRTISVNTTLTLSDEIVFLQGATTATFPASPTDGMRLVIGATNVNAAINGNGNAIYLAGSPSTGNIKFGDGAVNLFILYYSSTLMGWVGAY